MRRVFFLVAMASITLAEGSDLADVVRSSRDLTEIVPKLRGTADAVKRVEEIPDRLFELILSGNGTDKEWQALEHYSQIDDAGASMDFRQSCFRALQRQPLIFYRRFMKGDASGLARMRDALGYEFMAYENGSDANYEKYKAFFKQALDKIAGEKRTLAGEALKRHNKFVKDGLTQFSNWRKRYERK